MVIISTSATEANIQAVSPELGVHFSRFFASQEGGVGAAVAWSAGAGEAGSAWSAGADPWAKAGGGAAGPRPSSSRNANTGSRRSAFRGFARMGDDILKTSRGANGVPPQKRV